MPAHPEDIRNESILRKKWHINLSDPSRYPNGILVTGTNSFIGTHVIAVLQDQWDGPLHILVRASSEKEALLKMRQSFETWQLGAFRANNVFIHLGDVSIHRMGLTANDHALLREQVGTVIHLAMTPLYHLPYDHFKRMWVPELERMIAFCSDPHFPKSLHYASSFNANFFNDDEDFSALNTNAWQSGYAGFKWVAEQSLKNAFRQGLRGCIYNIPLVLGTEKAGICPRHYSIWMILDIFLKTGYFFKFNFRIIAVDILAKVMVFNIMEERKNNGASFIRPLLSEPVTDGMFAKIAAGLLGLKEVRLETVREAFHNKLRFDFLMPGNFYPLMEKVNSLAALFPEGFDRNTLPLTPIVFMSNLNRILLHQNKTSIE